MAQTRLTQEQVEVFYNEYLKQKTKKFAGDTMGKAEWKTYMEEALNDPNAWDIRISPGANWSNTEIRTVNRVLLRTGSWSRKQTAALANNYYEVVQDIPEIVEDLGVKTPAEWKRLVRNEEGVVYNYLLTHSANWFEYFNS